jgi:hypothetical protein
MLDDHLDTTEQPIHMRPFPGPHHARSGPAGTTRDLRTEQCCEGRDRTLFVLQAAVKHGRCDATLPAPRTGKRGRDPCWGLPAALRPPLEHQDDLGQIRYRAGGHPTPHIAFQQEAQPCINGASADHQVARVVPHGQEFPHPQGMLPRRHLAKARRGPTYLGSAFRRKSKFKVLHSLCHAMKSENK